MKATRAHLVQRFACRDDGFSLLQVLIVLAVAGIVTAAATMSIQSARRSLRLTNSARQFAGYLERVRTDSV